MKTQNVYSAENSNANVVAAGGFAAIAGGFASRFAPLTKGERAEVAAAQTFIAKDKEFQNIVEEFAKNQQSSAISDVFIKNKETFIKGSKDKVSEVVSGLDDSAKSVIGKAVDRIENAAKSVGEELDSNLVKEAKKSRPAFYFAAIAAVGAMTVAAVHNVIKARNVQQNNSVAINYEKDGVVIDAPDNMSLAIMLDQTV